MIRKLKLIAASALLSLGLAGMAALPVNAQGAAGGARNAVCEGITAGGGACADDGGGLQNVIATVINILSIVTGVAAVIMIVIGGLRFVTSGGDSSKVAGAKSAILYAIVGLVITALAQFIVRFVLGSAAEGN